MIGKCLFCQSREHSARHCRKGTYRGAKCCFTCGLPQKAYGKVIHGTVTTGECEAGLRDVVRGGCWTLYRDEKDKKWLRQWFERRGCEWKNEIQFREWTLEMEEEGEITNGVRILLEAWRDLVKER